MVPTQNITMSERNILSVYPLIVQMFFILTLFFVSIIVGNLITGLTVNNISELKEEARVFKLGKSVQEIRNCETFVKHRWIQCFKKVLPVLFDTSLFERIKCHSVCVEPNKHPNSKDFKNEILATPFRPLVKDS